MAGGVRRGANGKWVWANSGKPVNAPGGSRGYSRYRRRY
jgi:hypothetical protein